MTSTRPTSSTSRPQFIRTISSSSNRDKPRLYIALYPRGGLPFFRNNFNCDSYHWSLIIGPQTALRTDPGTRYHIAHGDDDTNKYVYEEQDIPSTAGAQTVLVRVAVAKVTDESRLEALLREIPLRQDDSAYTCHTWVREAFIKVLDDNKSVKSYLKADDWNAVEACARKYCKRKRDAGRFVEDSNAGGMNQSNGQMISTFNFWENRETTA
ncbi:hypothetical protein LTR10_018030 [Elasticomyces elasticus]|uniref:Uncharacterized protein n=1 Tax=Exophiala sideris TaxID=1016849 RepID=A0ABR0JPW2_9EURO|nr:hypothetical protein LTR10_018030 [Elasticomyces elasticus]KAK5039566.1 hypothetical protein LTS07_000060 [Exophiala sideris]KAK5041118.1 hypothetical protein LTR13_002592 [Exophiala sideris]KAK5067943.1 hypothetical protein LTR69_000060 [Exophiala sideris]KAK5187245.1 hypothetical protein LTR44_000060 [Eurotiomycetes sp. CCFEE 6388]